MRENNESVVGVDVSERMLETCKEKYPTFHLEVGSFTNTNQEDEAFDIVISSFVFMRCYRQRGRKLVKRFIG